MALFDPPHLAKLGIFLKIKDLVSSYLDTTVVQLLFNAIVAILIILA
jgi:hypothetical protein